MAPFGFFVQDEWHVRPNLTINVGLRYDYDPGGRTAGQANGETVNALNLPGRPVHHRIDSRPTAYTTGCGSPQMPPVRSGRAVERQPRVQRDGRRSHLQHAEQHRVLEQPADAEIHQGQYRPAHRRRLGVPAEDRSARRLRDLLRSHQLSQPVRGEHAARFHLALDARRLRYAQYRARWAPPPTPTVAPICNSLATCGPYGGYGISSAHRSGGKQPDRGGAHAVGFHLRRIHQRSGLQRSALAAVELPDRAAVVGHQHGFRGLCGQPHAAARMVLQGQLSAGRPLLPEQPGPGLHLSRARR